MDDVVAAVREFHARTAERTVDVDYLAWAPGSYRYLFAPTGHAIRFLSRRIAGRGLRRRLASTALQGSAAAPSLLRLVPRITTKRIAVPIDSRFDVAIAGYRLKLFRFGERSVTTLALRSDDFSAEVGRRRSLPDSINVPEILTYDESLPYFTERLIEGRELTDPVKEWSKVLDALVQLSAFYRSNGVDKVAIDDAGEDLTTHLSSVGILDDRVVERALAELDRLSLPSSLGRGRIHGDFHAGNLLTADGSVYVLDWEGVREGYLVEDFFKPFTSYYFDTGDATPVIDMLADRGRGSTIADEYASRLGALAFHGSTFLPGIPVFHLLDQLATHQTSDAARESHYYALLRELIAALDHSSR